MNLEKRRQMVDSQRSAESEQSTVMFLNNNYFMYLVRKAAAMSL